jgi:uncharacterized protein YdiU (UPF0061 family)
VSAPRLVILNEELSESLGLNSEALQSNEGAAVLAGNMTPDGGLPLAQAYAGHQFGSFTMLGDGRAILLGEQTTPAGERFDIQLKGSGRTPYSRGGDGRAALGPMLREYIVSEAMHALGIPTTRSLAVVTTGELVIRETDLPGAILTRVASSHLRVGTFQFVSKWGTVEELRILADYAINRHFPDVDTDKEPYVALLHEVIRRQAQLIAKWQLVGFVHGVMNTDNMTISGETIDYGPCAFLDAYDPETVFSSIDSEGRYAYGNQPYIAKWNLARFAETLLPLLHADQATAVNVARQAVEGFGNLYQRFWLNGMKSKLGMFNEEQQDVDLVGTLLRLMHKYRADYTNSFLALTFDTKQDTEMMGSADFVQWYTAWQERLARQPEAKEISRQLMRQSNPALIPRNHKVEASLEAAVSQNDLSLLKKFLKALSQPYAHNKEQEEYSELPAPSDLPYRTFCGT